MSKPRSDQNGAAKEGETVTQRVTQSTSAEAQPSTSGMLDTTVLLNPTFQAGKNYQAGEDDTAANIIQTFAAMLEKADLAEWRQVVLLDGRKVYALCFTVDKWQRDPKTKALTKRG